ncbi:OLC1v1035619C1 [Oldenlandia corymbosa var. corymbosa]|uniref:OLC1v1035619C1 n=1 Tax=Oldenlandia corymbosa var. corymbosa TaxID=529605 RepID=A0AAV1CTG9_OLDCO|nr:OLC1v1035619C1 [Oldenlandia corymbosa var. corymbosa]
MATQRSETTIGPWMCVRKWGKRPSNSVNPRTQTKEITAKMNNVNKFAILADPKFSEEVPTRVFNVDESTMAFPASSSISGHRKGVDLAKSKRPNPPRVSAKRKPEALG